MGYCDFIQTYQTRTYMLFVFGYIRKFVHKEKIVIAWAANLRLQVIEQNLKL